MLSIIPTETVTMVRPPVASDGLGEPTFGEQTLEDVG